MDNLLHDDLNPTPEDEDDTHSYMDEDDVHEVQRHHWLSETAVGVYLMQDSAHTRADSPLLGNDHPFLLAQEAELNKTLPDMSRPLSHLRSSSTASFASSASNGTPAVAATASSHRRSLHSQLSTPSRRPSIARKPSLPLLSESALVPQGPPPSVRQSARLHSIASSLSLGCNRNAVYIDSEEVSTRLDDWLSSGNPELEQEDDEDFDAGDYYVTSFERPQDSPPTTSVTPTYLQGPPPNTPMTVYYKPGYASSQIYVGQGATSDSCVEDDARSEESRIHIPSASPRRQQTQDTITRAVVIGQEDASATPVLHEKPLDPAPSFSSSSESLGGSPMFSATTFSTSRTSPSSIPPQSAPPPMLSSKPSLASLSMGVLSPKPSLTSIGLAYQNHILSPTDSNLLSPPPATASRWSLTSSVAGDVEKDKKKKDKVQKSPGGTRRRLASIISKLAGNSPSKEARQSSESVTPDQEKQVNTRERSFTDGSTRSSTLLPPAPIKARSKPPSLKLSTLVNSHSVLNLRSPTLSSKPSLSSLVAPLSPTRSMASSSTPMPTPTFTSPITTSPISATFVPTSPVTGSFASTRLSVSTSMTTTSTNTASPLMPTTPILSDAPLATPTLKSAVSVPALSANWERPSLVKRDHSFGWSMNSGYCTESSPTSPTKGYEDEDDLEDDAEYYVREFSLSRKETFEEERQARLSLITDMLDRDLKATSPQQDGDMKRDSISGKRKGSVKIDETEAASFISRTSPTHFRKSSSASRASMPPRRSVSGPSPIVPMSPSIPPPVPSKNGFRNLAARMGISNSISTPPPLPRAAKDTDAKRKSIASFVSNSKRKNPKRRLVISGVGDAQCEIDALKDWCASLGEVRNMVKVKSTEGEVTQIGQNESSGHNVWVVDFKKSSVAENASQMQAKVEIKGAGNVRLSWETAKPKISFGMGKKGWIP